MSQRKLIFLPKYNDYVSTEDRDFWKKYYTQYLEGKSLQDIGHDLGIDYITVRKYFISFGVKIRSKKERYTLARKKAKQTCLKVYGVDNVSKVDKVKRKMKRTNLKKYGVPCTLQSKESKEKIKNSIIENYGSYEKYNEYRFQQYEKNFKKVYGVRSPSQVPAMRKKQDLSRKRTFIKKYGAAAKVFLKKHNYVLLEDYKGEMHSRKKGYSGYIQYKLKHLDCGLVFRDDIFCLPRCPKCFIAENISQQHYFYSNFIKNLGFNVQDNAKVLGRKEIDIFLPELKIGFEINGIYFHNAYRVGKFYHSNKTKVAKRLGIKLYHIWEKDSPDIVKSMILNILRKSEKRYFARKLTFKQVNKKDASIFFQENHLHGNTNFALSFGLYDGDTLLSAISLRLKDINIELARSATKLHCQVVGGFSKIIKNTIPYIKNYKTLITYADRDWTPFYEDSVYFKAKFKYEGNTGNILRYTDGNKVYSRLKFQKHKLNVKNKTVTEYLIEKGINPLYNSGNWKFVLDLQENHD